MFIFYLSSRLSDVPLYRFSAAQTSSFSFACAYILAYDSSFSLLFISASRIALFSLTARIYFVDSALRTIALSLVNFDRRLVAYLGRVSSLFFCLILKPYAEMMLLSLNRSGLDRSFSFTFLSRRSLLTFSVHFGSYSSFASRLRG